MMSSYVLETRARSASVPVKFLILCVKEPRRKSRLIEFSLRRRNAFIQAGATARQRDERNHVETFLLLGG